MGTGQGLNPSCLCKEIPVETAHLKLSHTPRARRMWQRLNLDKVLVAK